MVLHTATLFLHLESLEAVLEAHTKKNFKEQSYPVCPFLVYLRKQRTSKLFM